MGVLLHRTFRFEPSNCFRITKEGVDGCRLLLEFVQVRSRVREMSCSAPAAEECLGYVYLGPSNMADWADEAGRIIKALHRLILCCTESPHISAPSKIMWAGGVDFLAHRVRSVWGWEAVDIGMSAGVPFRRRGHKFGGTWPISILSSDRLGINQWMCKRCVAIGGDLDHH